VTLKRIALRDFAIVEALELDLEDGFVVLTGETGAGKSILIDALQLALGSRADAGLVREGAARAEVAAEFHPGTLLDAWLREAGFEVAESLLVRRTVDTQGKSRGWINGSAATAAQLRAVGDHLVDIHGQHAWHSLTRPAAVRGLLDAFASIDSTPLSALWQQWRSASRTIESARGAQSTLQQERERLAWQIGEVDKLAPGSDEWAELNAKHTRLSHAQSLIETAQQAGAILEDDGSNVNDGALNLLARAHSLLEAQAHLEPEFTALAKELASALATAEDAARSLQTYLRRTDADPASLGALDERVALWLSLARRYHRSPEDLPALHQGWREDLARLEASADLTALQETEIQAADAYERLARAISRQRKAAAPRLSLRITQAMQGLGMQGGRFEVAIESVEAGPDGIDDVTFLVAGHAGNAPRPVGKVASGGELSRIALAIAVTTSQLGSAPTLIFDEVDAGIGGAVGQTVGQLMRQLGCDRQVLAVTHLAQVAACAEHHLQVLKQQGSKEKGSSTSTTQSVVVPLGADGRVQEISRMLGGDAGSAASLAHAREMLDQAATALPNSGIAVPFLSDVS
jgi:DNA repair protein RecN (Recombination protein N)